MGGYLNRINATTYDTWDDLDIIRSEISSDTTLTTEEIKELIHKLELHRYKIWLDAVPGIAQRAVDAIIAEGRSATPEEMDLFDTLARQVDGEVKT